MKKVLIVMACFGVMTWSGCASVYEEHYKIDRKAPTPHAFGDVKIGSFYLWKSHQHDPFERRDDLIPGQRGRNSSTYFSIPAWSGQVTWSHTRTANRTVEPTWNPLSGVTPRIYEYNSDDQYFNYSPRYDYYGYGYGFLPPTTYTQPLVVSTPDTASTQSQFTPRISPPPREPPCVDCEKKVATPACKAVPYPYDK